MAWVDPIEKIWWLYLRNNKDYRKFFDAIDPKLFDERGNWLDSTKPEAQKISNKCRDTWGLLFPVNYALLNPASIRFDRTPLKELESDGDKLVVLLDLSFKPSQLKARFDELLDKKKNSRKRDKRNPAIKMLAKVSKAYELHFLEGKTLKEVAEELSLEYGDVDVRMIRRWLNKTDPDGYYTLLTSGGYRSLSHVNLKLSKAAKKKRKKSAVKAQDLINFLKALNVL
jgi:hypothetical protein